MLLEIPAKLRSALYAISAFVNAMLVVVQTEVTLSVWVLGIVAGFNALIALLAKANVTPEE